ncbi:MAG: hypothetical protein ACTSQF_01475 [Candidatus Heimdallarchaeaceae archaeon]
MNLREDAPEEIPKELPKRLVTLDILRGIAIFGMILVHVSYKLFDASWLMDSINSGNLDFGVFTWILVVILGYLGTWHGFFLFISATVNSLVFARKIRAGVNPKKLLQKNIFSGTIIVVIGYFIEGFGYWGYFGTSFRDWAVTGNFAESFSSFRPFVAEGFFIQTLQIIGLAIIINGIILYFLLKDKGYEKTVRNSIVYGVLTVCILFITPFLNDLIENTMIPNWPDINSIGAYKSFGVWLLTMLCGPKFPLFPFLASAFIGSLIGVFLSNPKPKKKMLWNFIIAGVGLIIVGGIFVVIGFVRPDLSQIYHIFMFTSIENPPAVGFYMVRLGGQIILLMILLSQIEFKGKGEKFANRFVWKFFRRWGTFSLTIYSLHILELLPRFILTLVSRPTTGINLMEHYVIPKELFWVIIFIVIYVLMFYELVIQIFIQVKMKGSMEWFFVKLQGLFSKVKSNKLDSGLKKEEIVWVSYEETTTGSDD